MSAETWSPEEAARRCREYLASLEAEGKTTLRLVEAIPAHRFEFRVHPKARTVAEIAWHIATSRTWFAAGVAKKEFRSEGEAPALPADVPGLAKGFADLWARARQTLEALAGEDLAATVDFLGVAKEPAARYLDWCLSHEIHHRGQLSACLRAMGARVPGVYGGSADEPWGPDAS